MFTAELLGLAIRVSLFLAAGYLAARLLERKSAAMAHRALVMTLACTLMLPLIVMTVPGWQWNQPTWMAFSFTEVENASAVGTAQVDRTNIDRSPVQIGDNASESGKFPAFDLKPLFSDSLESSTFGEGIINRTDTQPSSAANPFQSPSSQPNPLPSGMAPTASPVATESRTWAELGVSAWFVVAGLLICRLLVSLFRLFAFVRRCTVASGDIVTQAEETASQLGLKCRIRVVLSGSDAMPMACWLGRWIIVLPSNFMTWNAALREATLVHELGHIARRDAWSDLIVQSVFCVFWPNPFVWLSVQDVRRLRERACDEWALQRSAIDVKTYAQCLLEVVQRCQTQQLRLASTMAGKKDLESRLRWLMSASRPRVARPVLTSVIVASITVLGLAIATAQPTRPQQTSAAEPGQNGANAPPVQSKKLHEVIVSKEPSPADPAISVAGIVTDTDGKPLAGMHVVLRAKVEGSYDGPIRHVHDVLARTTTNAEGRFTFRQIGIPPRMTDVLDNLREGKSGSELVVWGEGKAVIWQPVESFQNAEKHIQLTPEADVSGVGKTFVYIIDTSSSMAGSRLKVAQGQLKASLRLLQPNQQFAVIFYNDESRERLKLRRQDGHAMYFATDVNKELAGHEIDRIDAKRGTAHMPAIVEAISLKPDVIYFLTDGDEPELSPAQLAEIRRISGSITIHVIKFGDGTLSTRGPSWLERLASQSNGEYRPIIISSH